MLVFRWFAVEAADWGEAAKAGNPREQHLVLLYTVPPCGALASSASLACARVETYMRMTSIPYKKLAATADEAPRRHV